jgi:[protein-PII] uridylyltransferase
MTAPNEPTNVDKMHSIDDQLVDIKSLKEKLAQAASPVPAVRAALTAASNILDEQFKQGEDVRKLIAGRAIFMDQVLSLLWNRFSWAEADDISLIAVGGYGRGELHPYSDIDLLILSKTEFTDQYRENISSFVTLLWDLRLDIGQSARTMEECIIAAREDVTIATNLLETRTISGNEDLRKELHQHVYSDEIYTDRAYFLAKRDEQRQRHEKYGDTEYNLEPNLKASPGTLRDIQTIGWITKRHFGSAYVTELSSHQFLTDEELSTLRDGETFLWRMRYGLQMLAKRNENRLLFDHQRSLASLLGYSNNDKKLAVEAMMKEYYRVVLALAELADVILQYFDEAILRENEEIETTPLNKRFQIRGRYIEAINTGVFAYAPYALLEVFLLTAQNPQIKGFRASTIRSIRAHRHLINDEFRNNITNISLFMEILKTPHPLHQTLSYMKRYNILGRYLPEFGQIIGQMQHDLFHIYTVDAHTLRVLKNMVEFRQPESQEKHPLATRLIKRLPKLELVYIAGLYHDIAKGRGGDHSDLGAVDAEAFCKKHRLSERDTQLVAWLVKHHLLMSITAQKKDTQDPEVIHQFAREVPSHVHLDYLYVLTVADISATNPTLWNTWRSTLLRQLYLEARRALRRGVDNPIDRNDWIEATKQEALQILLEQDYKKRDVMKLWKMLEDDYFLQDSTTEIAWQTAAILAHGRNQEPLILIRDILGSGKNSHTQIMVYVRSRIDLFAATTAVLEQLNLNIVDARISSSFGPFSLSSFIVLDEHNQSLARDPSRKERIRQRLFDELDDPEDYPSIISRRTPRQLKMFAFPTEVTFSNDTINQRTVMEVITPDRPGLLARVGLVLLKHNISLVNAKIATLGERVEDVFFVTDENGDPLSDAQICQTLQSEICTQLDENLKGELDL